MYSFGIVMQALRRYAPEPTQHKVLAAMEGLQKFDRGELGFADLSIVGSDGEFKR